MSENPNCSSCINRSLTRSQTREQCDSIPTSSTPAFRIEEQLNEVYEKRLAEINEQAKGDVTLKEITYQEWIAMLRQINKTLITNIQEMERETTNRLVLLQQKAGANCHCDLDTELCLCRKDLAGLIQLIRNGRQCGDWSIQKFNFETITEQDIFGNEERAEKCEICPAVWGPEKLCCLQMTDVKSSESNVVEFAHTPRVDSYSNRDSINSLCSNPLDSLYGLNIPDDEVEEEEFIKCLKEELNQLFEMRRDYDQNVEHQRRTITDQQDRLSDMINKLLKNNNDLQTKLRFYRRELLNLENPQSSRTITLYSDGDSGISSDLDPDVKIINSVRCRIAFLVDENYRMKKDEKSLQIDYEDVNCKAIAKTELLEKTSRALREVADALSNALCKPVAYDKIFGNCQNMAENPIVEAVDDLMEALRERERTIADLRKQIANAGKLNQDLEGKSQQLFAEICDLKQTMSGAALPQNENRGKLFQNQEFSKRILEQNEELKQRLCNREEEVYGLQNQISQIQQRPCQRCTTRDARDERRTTPRSRSDSAEDLQKLESELRRRGKTVECLKSENVKLNDELQQIRRSQAKAKLLQRKTGGERGPSAAVCGDGSGSSNQDIITKLSIAEERNKEQYKSLQKAARDISNLQDEVEELRSKEETFSKERNLLQTELIALKEKQACQIGTQQSLHEQLQGTISELYVAKEKLHECMQVKDRAEMAHRDEMNRFQDLKAEMFGKYNNLVEDYNNILKEYQKVVQIEEEKTNQIRAFSAWKEEQIQIEKEVRKKMQMFENHIREMLEDKQNLLARLNDMETENRSLLQSMDQSGLSQMGSRVRCATSPARGYTVLTATASADPVSKVIQNVRNTSRRLSHQRSVLEEEGNLYYSK